MKFLRLSLLNAHFISFLGFILLFLKCNIIYLIFRAESKFQGLMKFLLLIIILWVSFHFYLRYIGKKKLLTNLFKSENTQKIRKTKLKDLKIKDF